MCPIKKAVAQDLFVEDIGAGIKPGFLAQVIRGGGEFGRPYRCLPHMRIQQVCNNTER
jgi:hypothetical protein